MADTDQQTDAPADTDDAKDDDAPAGDDELAKWKHQSRKHERESKQLAARLKELEDAGKSEQDKLAERLKDLEPKLTAAEKRALRLEIAIDKGLPKSLAMRLQGDTEEEMAADADVLLETLGDRKTPAPSFDGGPRNPPPNGEGDMNQAIRRALGRS